MNTKTIRAIFALALGLLSTSLPVHADAAMSGMDMGGMKMPQPAKPAPLSVIATVNPAAPRTGDNTLDLMIADAAGKPVTGLKLTTTVMMTSMDMGTTHPTFTETGGGHYTAKVNFGMDGPWRVVVRNQAIKIVVMNFEAGAKTPWKSPQIKAADIAPGKPAVPAENPMPGMDMSGGKTTDKKGDQSGSMAGMDMGNAATKPTDQPAGSTPNAGASDTAGMKMTGIAGLKTATIPELQEKGIYTATGDENWEKQTGFGHNAGMVGMMNQMMVGGSGMEGMKMPAMKMDFGEKNYAKPDTSDTNDSMAGMEMSGSAKSSALSKLDDMTGMKMGGKGDMKGMDMSPAAKPDAQAPPKQSPPATEAPKADIPKQDQSMADLGQGGMKGMDMSGGKSQPVAPTTSMLKITAAMPSSSKAGDNALNITVMDSDGKPITGATITTSVAMTSMDMGTTHPSVTEKGAGQYATTVNLSMAGPWRVKLKVMLPGQKPQNKAFDFTAR